MVLRPLDTFTLGNAAKDYAAWFIRDSGKFDRAWVMKQFYQFTYKDEFEFLVEAVKPHLGPSALADFEARVAVLLVDHPRSDAELVRLLEERRPVGYVPIAEREKA